MALIETPLKLWIMRVEITASIPYRVTLRLHANTQREALWELQKRVASERWRQCSFAIWGMKHHGWQLSHAKSKRMLHCDRCHRNILATKTHDNCNPSL